VVRDMTDPLAGIISVYYGVSVPTVGAEALL